MYEYLVLTPYESLANTKQMPTVCVLTTKVG